MRKGKSKSLTKRKFMIYRRPPSWLQLASGARLRAQRGRTGDKREGFPRLFDERRYSAESVWERGCFSCVGAFGDLFA